MKPVPVKTDRAVADPVAADRAVADPAVDRAAAGLEADPVAVAVTDHSFTKNYLFV